MPNKTNKKWKVVHDGDALRELWDSDASDGTVAFVIFIMVIGVIFLFLGWL